MKHLILGTAGHVDHGKTSLVKVLTGIDCDRLKEEKERGITIELGFAHLLLPSGRNIGIVDVPGHERFIRTMIAGATGIDILALIIAADEGVMPQTREHLQICSLLGIKKGLVALTKTDLVDAEWQELVHADILEFLRGSPLEEAPIVPVSAATGFGLPELLSALDKVAAAVGEDYDCGIMRLPVDRVFTVKGFGSVVTGTMISGKVTIGETVEIMPAGRLAKIRGIQVHNQNCLSAYSGQRVALNLQGIEKEHIQRGDVIAQPGYLKPGRRMDVYLEHLPGTKNTIKHRALVRFLTGTGEVMARLHLLDRHELPSGQSCFAQVFLSKPTACIAGDKFIIRSYSPVTTLGGGTILDPSATKLKRHVTQALDTLGVLRADNREAALLAVLQKSGSAGVKIKDLTAKTGLRQEDLRPLVKSLLSARKAVLVQPEDTHLVADEHYRGLQSLIVKHLQDYHSRFPLNPGMPKEELRGATGGFILSRLFALALNDLEKQGKIIVDRENLRLAEHQINLNEDLEEIKQALLKAYLQYGLSPPDDAEILARVRGDGKRVAEIFKLLTKEGLLVRIKENYHLHREVLVALQGRYLKLLKEKSRVSPTDLKEITGLSRKYLIPLMEYFDMIKFTIRAGDYRILKATKTEGNQ